MKKLILLAFAALLFAPLAAPAQQLIQQAPQHLDAASLVQTSATTSTTLTLTPPAGSYVYINNLEITNCANGSAITAAAPTTVTTTNLGGAAWTIGSGVTAGLCQPTPASGSFVAGFRSSAPGTAATIVLPAFVTNQTVRVTVYYYFAP